MATRRFNLEDTMSDAISAIEQSKSEPSKSVSSLESEEKGIKKNQEHKDTSSETDSKSIKGKRGRKPKMVNPELGEKDNIRNVSMDDRTLWRLEYVKRKLNKQRGKGDQYVSVDSLLYQAGVEFLNRHYPETYELYDKASAVGLL